MLDAYRQHVAERAAQNIPPAPLSPEQVAELVELIQSPPAGEENFLIELLTERVPPGVDDVNDDDDDDSPRVRTFFYSEILFRGESNFIPRLDARRVNGD